MNQIPLVNNEEYNKEPRISGQTFCQLFDDHSQFDDFFIVDCRTEREYEGGHIKTAIRCHPLENSKNIPNLYHKFWSSNACFIFHCEFSSIRGPTAYRLFLTEHNNSANSNQSFNTFILDGGYSEFYAEHEDYCIGTYVAEMST